MTLDEVIARLKEIRKTNPGDLEVFYLEHVDAPPVTVDKIIATTADERAEDFGYEEGQPFILISNDIIEGFLP